MKIMNNFKKPKIIKIEDEKRIGREEKAIKL